MFECYSIWDKLRETSKPIFLYGTGNGADKIIDALETHGGVLRGVFASDGFVRERYFRGHKVLSHGQVVSKYGDDIIVLLAFGTIVPDVVDFIYKLDERHELIIPDVPLYGGNVFDYEYFQNNSSSIIEAVNLLADDKSKSIFRDAINFRLTGKLKYTENTSSWNDSLTELLASQSINFVLDGGAFKGDSTSEFINALSPKKIIAVEADPKTFIKLAAFADNVESSEVVAVNAALWNCDGEIEYVHSGSRGSGEAGANKRAKISNIPCATIDTILKNHEIDLIKLDIEGAESEALEGAIETISRCSPNMIISLYHKTDDLYNLIKVIHKLLPNHKLYLRRIPCIPMWDLNLYAVRSI